MRTFILGLALGAGALSLSAVAYADTAPAQPVQAAPVVPAACPGNLLVNPNFDGPSRKTESEGTSLSSAVANGWFPWLIRGNARFNREPEYKIEWTAIGGDPFRTLSGGRSMKWFTTWGTHDAGIYQRVPVKPGQTVDFSTYSMAYSGEADGWDETLHTHLSDANKPGKYRMYVGIDPTGATPAGVGAEPPSTVIWSEPSLTTDTWVPLHISTKATGPAVTVYAKGQPEFAVKHNDSWWENACLRVVPAPRPLVKKTGGALPVSTKTP
jgi:hypothetical protein